MNCQEFRKSWIEDTDSDTLSHIETCEDCIAWIETQMISDEEVQFLKEVPLPQANLEERIMQAIYQSAGQGVPPHAASIQPTVSSVASKRRTKGFPSFAWVSAAAVLLAVGFVGYQQLMNPNQMQTASEAGSSQSNANNAPAAAYNQSAHDQTPASASPDTPVQSPSLLSKQSAPEQAVPKQKQEIAKMQPAAAPASPTTAPEGEIAMISPKQKTATSESRASEKQERPVIVARNVPEKPAADSSTAKKAATALPDATNEAKSSTNANQAAAANNEAASDQTVYSMTAASVPDTKTDAGTPNALVGPPAPAAEKSPITLSTFSDVETAVQASDMPVPVMAQVPAGFTMNEISVQYESETSQKVSRLWADFKRNQDWIKVEVVRNDRGKRSLSIPGTFTATQLFSVNGEQAIAVSFDQQGAKESAAQHAVHFNAQSRNQSLYVVLTAHGIRLDELMDASKQLSWKP